MAVRTGLLRVYQGNSHTTVQTLNTEDQMTRLHRWTLPGMALPGVLAIAATVAARSATGAGISGTAELTYTDQHAATVPDAPGHVLVVGEARGTNRSADQAYFPDAQVVSVDHADLMQGSGPHWGYYTMSLRSDTVVARWSGSVTSTMKRGQPQTGFRGSWEYVKGTGAYTGIRGKGSYDGHFLAKNRYVVNWRGSYTK